MITSLQNPTVKQIIRLKTSKGRKKTNQFIVEGLKSISELDENWQVDYLIYTEDGEEQVHKELAGFHPEREDMLVSEQVFKAMTDTVTPQGYLAVVQQRYWELHDIIHMDKPFFVLLDQLQDPGNIGTIIRTADAAGADAVILAHGSADIYNPKIVRSTMGSLFHLPVINKVDMSETIQNLKDKEIGVYAAHLKGATYPYELDLTGGVALLIGNEGNGLSQEIADKATNYVKVPMLGKAESLNAAIAASILAYEVVRQRI